MTDHSKKIVVTGGTGKVGQACVKDLMAHGYQVLNVDSIAPREQLCPFIVAELADFGGTLDALSSMDVSPYVPVDEECSFPESVYSLSKLLGKEMVRQFCRWDPEMKIIGLRFSNILERHDYAAFPDLEKDPHLRKWNLWGYIEFRDFARAIRLALEVPLKGADVFAIANPDTLCRARHPTFWLRSSPACR
jgi:nucleoside-diphosphate-sugar epimerase